MRVRLTTLLVPLMGAVALAHDGAHDVYAPSWWDLSALAALALGGGLYAVGSWRLAGRGAHVRRLERVAFWAGWTAVLVAISPATDRAAAETFSMHMAQHELLMVIGAPLVIVGRPIVPWVWALPGRMRPFAGASLQMGAVSRVWNVLTTPVVAWAAHGLAIWIWHLPALYEAAVNHEGVHALQHATFIGTAACFWWGLVYGRYGRAAYGASVLYVFTTMVHTGLLGAVFALSTWPFYGVYRERAAAAGIDAVSDQQLAGVYMWVPAGIVFMICGLALLLAWLAEAERRSGIRSVR
jgi:putative membrane protein